MLRVIVIYVLFYLKGLVAIASSEDGLLSVEQIRLAMQSERSKVINGAFVASGEFKIYTGDKLEKEDKLEWRYEFDYHKSKFLFDRSENCDADSKTRGGNGNRLRVFFCEDSAFRYTYCDLIIPTAALRVEPIRLSEENLPHQFQRLDVRGLGFCNFSNIYSLSRNGDKVFFETVMTKIDINKDIKVTKELDGLLRLSFEKQVWDSGPKFQMSLWVDSKKGYSPVRLASFMNGEPEIDSRSDWIERDNVWVPSRLFGTCRSPFLPSGKEADPKNIEYKTEEFQMNLEWQSVNSTGGVDVYDYRDFDLPKGTPVYKERKAVHFYGHESQETANQEIGLFHWRTLLLLVFMVSSIGFILLYFVTNHLRRK